MAGAKADDEISMMPGLVAVRINKAFGRRQVLRNVSLHLQRGEVVGLLGPNGAGKTTCFYAITGLVPSDNGSILLDGRDVARMPMYKRARLGIGYLPQEASVFRGLNVEQNIGYVAQLLEPNRVRRRYFVDELLAEFRIEHLRRVPATALSGGERRRVEVARALATRPTFMLLDEPFAGIDPISISDIRTLILQLKERNIGVLLSDHNVRETLQTIDRGYVIYDGEVLSQGRAADIVSNASVRQVYLGDRFKI